MCAQILGEVRFDLAVGECRWAGSYCDGLLRFETDDVKVEISQPTFEAERLAARTAGKPLTSGRVRVDTPNETRVKNFLLRGDLIDDFLRDLDADPRAAALLCELRRMLSAFFGVEPSALARQIDEIVEGVKF